MTFLDRICDIVTQLFGSLTTLTGSGAVSRESAIAPPPESKAMAGMISSILRMFALQY